MDKCNQKVAIIHNCDGNEIINFKEKPDFYFRRPNIGMDIGAFQWFIKQNTDDIIYWFTDDQIPMKKNLLRLFQDKINIENVGLVGHNYSPKNIRTTAFAIKKEVADKIKFPEPVTTREECLQFEHGFNNLTDQVLNMGYKVLGVHGEGESGEVRYSNYLWDNHYYEGLNLWKEFEKEFGHGTSLVCHI